MEHPVSKGYFCNLKLGRDILPDDVERIKDKMREIIKAIKRI
jgi:uridine kinase